MILNRPRIAQHEAAHAASFIMAGRLPTTVTADRPAHRVHGEVRLDWPDGIDHGAARDVAVAVLAGPLHVGEPDWPPEWPLDGSEPGDHGQLAACVRYLDLDERGYRSLVKQARDLSRSVGFGRIVRQVARALELVPSLDADDLRRLLGPETLTKYGIETEAA